MGILPQTLTVGPRWGTLVLLTPLLPAPEKNPEGAHVKLPNDRLCLNECSVEETSVYG